MEDDTNAKFQKKTYWDDRFAEEEEYDWLLKYEDVADSVTPLLDYNFSILIVGCGNSTFSRQLFDAGYTNIINIDYSGVVIEHMRKLHSDVGDRMTWLEMDMTDLSFDNCSFDVVIDKAAMDALMVTEGDVWNPDEEVISASHKMCCEVRRVLKTEGGKFIQISFAQPHFRTKYLMGYRAKSISVSPFESHQGHSDVYQWDLNSGDNK
eukprot:CAMPEP_0175033074 /NCGR_PEP_ID=MMETSP0005-20121125/21786_1 /TAXON_ID=420556 /ORGANISM="Ochromonas sp., Strain CCMP1393" /LENGTH=207 /DNA_ID=CAMNT_0016293629 /DNA_START=13 /DNA_END=635 /DNA_ORIENTATION=-